MRLSLTTVSLLTLLFCSEVFPARAQDSAAKPAASSASGFMSDFLKQLDDVEKKFVGLAEATPQEKYSYRPGPKIRSTSEVFMHIAGANYMIPRAVGGKVPEGLSPNMEKTVTDKAQVVDMLKKSFASVRQLAQGTSESDLDRSVKLFGRDSTVRGVWFLIANHMHEHLGQSIAYARVNGVKPPWSSAD